MHVHQQQHSVEVCDKLKNKDTIFTYKVTVFNYLIFVMIKITKN